MIAYEDLAADAQGVFDAKIFPFLRLRSFPIFTAMVKHNTRPLKKFLENFEELKALDKPFDFEASWSPDKRKSYPPDLEREPGKEYVFRV